MTPNYVITSIKLYLVDRNVKYNAHCQFGRRIMSDVEVVGGGLRNISTHARAGEGASPS